MIGNCSSCGSGGRAGAEERNVSERTGVNEETGANAPQSWASPTSNSARWTAPAPGCPRPPSTRCCAAGALYQRSLIMTHRDRAGDPPGRRGAVGDAGHRQGFPTHSGGSPERPEAASQGFRAASRAASDVPHRRATRSWPKALGNRLYGSLSRTFGIRGRILRCGFWHPRGGRGREAARPC